MFVLHLFRRYQSCDVIKKFQLMCYDAVLTWEIPEQFRIHSFHSFSNSATSEYGTVPERTSENE